MKVLSELTSWDKYSHVKKDHEYREGFGKKIWGQKIRSRDRPAAEIFLPVNFFAKLLELIFVGVLNHLGQSSQAACGRL